MLDYKANNSRQGFLLSDQYLYLSHIVQISIINYKLMNFWTIVWVFISWLWLYQIVNDLICAAVKFIYQAYMKIWRCVIFILCLLSRLIELCNLVRNLHQIERTMKQKHQRLQRNAHLFNFNKETFSRILLQKLTHIQLIFLQMKTDYDRKGSNKRIILLTTTVVIDRSTNTAYWIIMFYPSYIVTNVYHIL